MYKHVQSGWLLLTLVGLGILLTGYLGILCSNWIALTVFGMLVICAILFASLTVTVNNNFVEIRFGVGVVRRKFTLEEIKSCAVVRNRWWYGWGIRKISKGWLFNVSGLDAVELAMRNGRVYRIGTDEPQKLSETIRKK